MCVENMNPVLYCESTSLSAGSCTGSLIPVFPVRSRRDGAVRCEDCTLDCCGFVGIAAAQGGQAEVIRCAVKRSGHFGLLATDPGSAMHVSER